MIHSIEAARARAYRHGLMAACALGAVLAGNSQAWADASADASASPVDAPEVDAVVITAAKGKAADVAPVKSSLKATEPTAVITRQFIEESAPRVGDFTTTASLAPSMGGVPNANGPGATDGAKITMRGFADGEFNVTYDAIAWGDTNGPSHHANSFFPSSVIGGVVIDRGPGNATDLGQANFGGSLNLFSLPLEDEMGARQTLTAGSFSTYQSVTTLLSGPMAKLHGLNIVANFMEYSTKGYLTNSPSAGQNQFLKFALPLNDRWSLTALYTHNDDNYYQSDSSAADVFQTETFGKNFALSNDPTEQTYKGYNYTKKQTDFEYGRLKGDLGGGFGLENTVYSYWYSNKTLSGADNTQDETLPGFKLANSKVILTPPAAYPAAGKGYPSAAAVAGLPGYLKRNEYRVLGDVFKGTKDFSFGTATAGVMWEMAHTQRSRFDIDLITRQRDFREKAALVAGPSLPYTQVPLDTAYNEYSGWKQYQAFAQFEWRPTDSLTITPGVKYVHFDLHVEAPALAVKGSIQPAYVGDTYTKTLPFLTANYRIRPNWSVYAQYAQGFLVPNISAFYVNDPSKPLVPQESTNYQLGTVYNAGRLTLDADVYHIVFKNKIQTINDPATPGETIETNSGGAIYRGVEVQATYLLDHGISVFGNYSRNDAYGTDDPINTGYNGAQIAKAPHWTAAGGVRLARRDLFTADDGLIVTLNDKWIGSQFANAASGAVGPTGIIKAFGEADLSATYKINRYSVEFQVINLADAKDITSFKGKAIGANNLPYQTSAAGGGLNVFTYQSGRSYQLTLKAVF
jgi:iron complex outermembrane receptor protein